MSGLTLTGFEAKSLEDIKADIEARLIADLGPSIDLDARSVLGQLVGIQSAKLAELWEVAAAVYSAGYPDTAAGLALDAVAAITGATRLPATRSTVVVTCSGDVGTVLPGGRVLTVDPGGARFASVTSATIGGGGTVAVTFEAEEYGPVLANAGTLTEIDTPIAGWDSATNAADADIGRDLETDADFRLRREQLLRRTGGAAVDAIRADVLAVEDVTACFVFENVTLITDGDGVPGKAVEVLVEGGDNDDIREAIFASRAAGIATHGSVTGTVEDAQGFTHTIKFSRPTVVDLVAAVTILTDDDFPGTGAADVKSAMAAFIEDLEVGEDVILSQLFAPIFSVSGVVDVTVLQVGVGAPGAANITITSRQLADLDTGNITLTVT